MWRWWTWLIIVLFYIDYLFLQTKTQLANQTETDLPAGKGDTAEEKCFKSSGKSVATEMTTFIQNSRITKQWVISCMGETLRSVVSRKQISHFLRVIRKTFSTLYKVFSVHSFEFSISKRLRYIYEEIFL